MPDTTPRYTTEDLQAARNEAAEAARREWSDWNQLELASAEVKHQGELRRLQAELAQEKSRNRADARVLDSAVAKGVLLDQIAAAVADTRSGRFGRRARRQVEAVRRLVLGGDES